MANKTETLIKEYLLKLQKKYPHKRLIDISFCNIIDFEYKKKPIKNENKR